MRLPPATLLAGVARTLEDDVLPAVGDRSVRGLVFAAIEVLANVQDLVAWRPEVRDEELASAAAALTDVAARFEALGLRDAADEIRRACSAADAIADVEERGAALDAALGRALVLSDEARGSAGDADAALAPVRTHLVNQALRDLFRIQRPLLNRISQG